MIVVRTVFKYFNYNGANVNLKLLTGCFYTNMTPKYSCLEIFNYNYTAKHNV